MKPLHIKFHCLAIFGSALLTSALALADDSMVKIPAGSFKMGADGDKAVHEQSITAFALAKHLVTRAEFEQFITETNYDAGKGWRKPLFKQTPNDPVINVSMTTALAYIEWLNKKSGEKYRLPTEAEWEYAARAGTKTNYFWGDDIGKNNANCDGCGSEWDSDSTAPVGSFAANPWGLFDMGGNAAQWTQDCFFEDEEDAKKFAETGVCKLRVIRGGGWNDSTKAVRVHAREGNLPDFGYMNVGLRLARDL
ncbi:MAG: formylglycine-generating enzyme family protein [Spongiibacteraceae bacterium]